MYLFISKFATYTHFTKQLQHKKKTEIKFTKQDKNPKKVDIEIIYVHENGFHMLLFFFIFYNIRMAKQVYDFFFSLYSYNISIDLLTLQKIEWRHLVIVKIKKKNHRHSYGHF